MEPVDRKFLGAILFRHRELILRFNRVAEPDTSGLAGVAADIHGKLHLHNKVDKDICT